MRTKNILQDVFKQEMQKEKKMQWLSSLRKLNVCAFM